MRDDMELINENARLQQLVREYIAYVDELTYILDENEIGYPEFLIEEEAG